MKRHQLIELDNTVLPSDVSHEVAKIFVNCAQCNSGMTQLALPG
jgi:hypothetical protein